MRRMQLLLILGLAFVLHFTDKTVLGKLAIVGGNVTLTASKSCTGNLELTTAENNPKTLTRRDYNGLWTAVPEGPFIGRVLHHAASSLTLTDLNYKDNGHVVFVCNGEDLNTVQLKVLVPDIRNVTEGERVELSCYSSAEKQVKWFKEEGEVRDRDAFSKEDEASPGRFLLILEKVRLEDQGVYFCDAPMAFKLIVNPRKPKQTTSPPSHQCNTAQCPNEGNEMGLREINWVLVALLGALVIVVIVLAIFLYLEKKKGRQPNESPELGGKKKETDGLLGGFE